MLLGALTMSTNVMRAIVCPMAVALVWDASTAIRRGRGSWPAVILLATAGFASATLLSRRAA